MMSNGAYDGPVGLGFLKHLLWHILGKLLVVWNHRRARRSHAINDCLSAGGAQRIHLAPMPSCVPDLNQGVLDYLKRVELGNICCDHLTELRDELRKAMARLRHKKSVIRGFIRQVYPDLEEGIDG